VEDGRVRYLGHERRGGEVALAVADRLRFSRRERRCVAWLVENHLRPLGYSGEWTDSAVRRLAREAGDHLERLLELAEADIAAHAPGDAEEGADRLSRLRKRLERLSLPRGERVLPREAGKRLAELVPEDRREEIGRLLDELETAVARGELERMPPVDRCVGYLRERGELEGLEQGQEDHPGSG
jgi:poly(A) polymerase